MSIFSKIDHDLSRFKDIVKKKVKSDLAKYIGSDHIVGKQGNKLVKIPLKYINVPRFTFGKNDGASQGDGDDGDPIDGKGKKKGKADRAGDGHEENDFSAEFSKEELASIVREELQLPRLEPKAIGNLSHDKTKWNTISNAGSDGMRHFKRTYKEAMKRTIGEGTYNFSDPKIIPIHADKRYKASSPVKTPTINCTLFFIIDCSGSMDDDKKKMAKTLAYWISLLVETSYDKVEKVWICHDTEASEITEDQFFKVSGGGGTMISSGYEKVMEIIDAKYPPSQTNNYVFSFTDDENSGGDNDLCISLLKDKLLGAVNIFAHTSIVNGVSNGDYAQVIGEAVKDEKLRIATVSNNEDDILKALKVFFAP